MNPDITQAPKQFCDNIVIAPGRDFFMMGVLSGNSGTVYTLTPSHMKNLLKSIEHQVAKFEEIHGEIKSDWTPNVPSPFQAKDLKDSGEGEED